MTQLKTQASYRIKGRRFRQGVGPRALQNYSLAEMELSPDQGTPPIFLSGFQNSYLFLWPLIFSLFEWECLWGFSLSVSPLCVEQMEQAHKPPLLSQQYAIIATESIFTWYPH